MRFVVAVVALICLATACAGDNSDQTIRVMAASSLTDVMDDLVAEFRATNPDIDVEVVLGGSSSLVNQLAEGAPADVLITADQTTMDRAVDDGSIAKTTAIATNRALLATTDDLAEAPPEALTVAVCAEQVPCGAAATDLFDTIGIRIEPTTLEPNVRSVFTKLELGEVDAGVIYSTDLIASDAGLVESTSSQGSNIENQCVLGLTSAENAAASTFADFVDSPAGQSILVNAGFGPPATP